VFQVLWSILARTSGSKSARKMLNSRQLALSAAAQYVLAIPVSQAQTSDVPGSDDHPMVTRYEGSVIDGYEVRDYDSFRLPLGPAVWNDDRVRVPSQQLDLEGRKDAQAWRLFATTSLRLRVPGSRCYTLAAAIAATTLCLSCTVQRRCGSGRTRARPAPSIFHRMFATSPQDLQTVIG
jgi:hypothetical protein